MPVDQQLVDLEMDREFDLGKPAFETVSLGRKTGAATHFGAFEGIPEAC